MRAIRVYPGFNAYYYSFYLEGLHSVFKKKQITFSVEGFPRFGHHCLALIVEDQPQKKLYISASDGPGFSQDGLDWCDLYAKINIDPDNLPDQHREKIMPIGPSYGVMVWSWFAALWHSVRNYQRCKSGIQDRRNHFANYWRQVRYRLPIDAYQPAPSQRDYIFFAASLWKQETELNLCRARFIETCRTLPGIAFEGGFAPRTQADMAGFEEITMTKRIPFGVYLKKMKRSAVAFNTPAVAQCLGWKLGEFLALGKAIVSLPTTRLLPAPLVHGTHIHYVDGSADSIREAVSEICANDSYRATLERGAREYYESYLAPASVIRRIFTAAQIDLA